MTCILVLENEELDLALSSQHGGSQDYRCLVAQLCPALGDPMDYNPPGSSFHVILQARILECIAVSSSKSQDRG